MNDDAVTLFPFNPNTMLSDDVGDTYESNLTVSKIYLPFLDLNRKLYEIIKTRFQSIESFIFKGKLPSSTALTILAPTHSWFLYNEIFLSIQKIKHITVNENVICLKKIPFLQMIW